MSKFEELKRKVETYEIMKQVADEYRKAIRLIDREKEYFKVESITYHARGDSMQLPLNSYYAPIPYTVIRDGLQAALTKLEGEMSEMEKELKEWIMDDTNKDEGGQPMTDEQLKAMSKADANASLSLSDMHRWVQLHNATANLYFVKNGKIEDVEPAGWWY